VRGLVMMGAHEAGGGIRATVTHSFKGVADGEIYPRTFAPGDVITGSLAVSAIGSGRAKATPAGAPENKADAPKKVAGPAGQDELSSSPPAGQVKRKRTSTRRAAKRS